MMIITFPDIEQGQGPVQMLNMLQFRDRQLYFESYIPAFNRVTQLLGIDGVKVTMVNTMLGSVVAEEGETWDAVALVEYPSAEAFRTVAMSNEYKTIAEPLRLAALVELKLYMTRASDIKSLS